MPFIALSSSRGSTFQAVIDAIRAGTLGDRCLGLIADAGERECVAKARDANIPVAIVERAGENFDDRLLAAIAALHPTPDTVIALMGWMHILSRSLLERLPYRTINVHPSLLPDFGGRGMYGRRVHEAVLKAGARVSGMTIHHVTPDVDGGEIILQKTCDVRADDTPDSLQQRVQALEQEWYPVVLQELRIQQ